MANPLAFLGNLGSLGGDLVSTALGIHQQEKQEDFQAKYSNSAYQRAAIDLEKAGLNRVLALGSPATTPSGSMANIPSLGESAARGTDVATRSSSAKSTIDLQKLEGELKAANVPLVREQTIQAQTAAELNRANSAKAAADAAKALQDEKLSRANTRIADSTADMVAVKRAGYNAAGPAVERLSAKGTDLLNSALDWLERDSPVRNPRVQQGGPSRSKAPMNIRPMPKR